MYELRGISLMFTAFMFDKLWPDMAWMLALPLADVPQVFELKKF